MITIDQLKLIASEQGVQFEIEKEYTQNDRMAMRYDGVKEDDCIPFKIYYGMKLDKKSNTYIWFSAYDKEDTTLHFDSFYNQGNGAKQKSYNRYFKWLQKHNIS